MNVVADALSEEFVRKIRSKVRTGEQEYFHKETDNALTFKGRLCVPRDKGLRYGTIRDSHETLYTAHPGSTMMYLSMKK